MFGKLTQFQIKADPWKCWRYPPHTGVPHFQPSFYSTLHESHTRQTGPGLDTKWIGTHCREQACYWFRSGPATDSGASFSARDWGRSTSGQLLRRHRSHEAIPWTLSDSSCILAPLSMCTTRLAPRKEHPSRRIWIWNPVFQYWTGSSQVFR